MASKHKPSISSNDPFWYRDAIIYQLHVRSFFDSTGDGIGDFRGLAQKLDYIRDLGVTAIWLLPFYPSPMRDDGYDISNYTGVNPAYGTLADFKYFLREAHARRLRVITELVVNHTSDEHPWFQKARRSPSGSAARAFYVWSDTPERYKDARVIFKDFETSNWAWDPVAGAYFWHRFYSHQPDLNFQNPRVRKELMKAMDFWLDLGVDGFRLDAVPYLHEREETTSENLPETHAELKLMRAHIDGKYGGRMLLAEANQWPEDAAAYFGKGDECHMAFHFPLMPRMFMALRMEDRYPVIDILAQTPSIPADCQWALFLRNHDELTLEMVTDEERDYMYRMYAKDPQARINLGIRRRLAPLLDNDIKSIELMNGLLLSLPGTPIIYYGDEIGMGDNIYLGDRNAVRTPMQWSHDRNAGFSRCDSQRLFLPVITDRAFSYETLNVEAQQNNPHSLLWWTRRLILMRRRFSALSRGTLRFLYPRNRKVLAFIRDHEGERVLVVANLSRFMQYVELDLSEYEGLVPIEAFGLTRFPVIGTPPYFLTLGPRLFAWFVLEPAREDVNGTQGVDDSALPCFEVEDAWLCIFDAPYNAKIEDHFKSYVQTRRWFGGKARTTKSTEIYDVITLGESATSACILLRVDYTDGDPELYLMTVSFASGPAATEIQKTMQGVIIAKLNVDQVEGILYVASYDSASCLELLDVVARRRHLAGRNGELVGIPARAFRAVRGIGRDLSPTVLGMDQSNSSILFGRQLVIKLFRKLEEGSHPEVEVGRYLTETAKFAHSATFAGQLEYRSEGKESITVGVLHAYVHNEGDAWNFTLDQLSQYFERGAVLIAGSAEIPVAQGSVFELSRSDIPDASQELIGTYLEAARLLGQRTGEMHLALASSTGDPQFKPEPFTMFYQRSLVQSFRNLVETTLEHLAAQIPVLSPTTRQAAEGVLAGKLLLMQMFGSIQGKRVAALRTRTHGDYHLGQVLWTGRDFVIIDLEGEPARPISARRIKRSPLRDVAGMIRSFHYAAHRGSLGAAKVHAPEASAMVDKLAEHWFKWSASAFLRAYLKTVADAAFLPREPESIQTLLDIYLLEKAIYEVGYELDHRPDWVFLPLRGIEAILGQQHL